MVLVVKLSTNMWSLPTRYEPPPSATMTTLVVLTMGIAIDNFLATPPTACVSNPMNLLGETPSCLSMAALVTTVPATLSPDRPQLAQQTASDDVFSSVPHELSQPHRLMLFDHLAMIVLSRVGRPLLPAHGACIFDVPLATLLPLITSSDELNAPHNATPRTLSCTRAASCAAVCSPPWTTSDDLACWLRADVSLMGTLPRLHGLVTFAPRSSFALDDAARVKGNAGHDVVAHVDCSPILPDPRA